MRCGYCFGEIVELCHEPGRCSCGRRAITHLGDGLALVHREECFGDTPYCGCWGVPRDCIGHLEEMLGGSCSSSLSAVEPMSEPGQPALGHTS